MLTAVLVLEVDDHEEAVGIAAGWPDLDARGDHVDLSPVRTFDT